MKKIIAALAAFLAASPVCLAQNSSPNYPSQSTWQFKRPAAYDAGRQGWTPPPGWTPPGTSSSSSYQERQEPTRNNFAQPPQTFTRATPNPSPTAPAFNINKVQYAPSGGTAYAPPAPVPAGDLVGYAKSDFPLPPARDEAEQFCIPVFEQAAAGGMKKRAFRMM